MSKYKSSSSDEEFAPLFLFIVAVVIVIQIVRFLWVYIVIVIGVIASLILLGIFVVSAIRRPRETALSVTAPIWLPHYVVVWVILAIARNVMVRYHALRHGYSASLVRLWLWRIPLTLALIWAAVIMVGLYWLTLNIGVSIVLGLLSALLLMHCYYYVYYHKPPTGLDWYEFIGIEKLQKLERQLTYIERRLELKLWWLALWS